MDHTYIEEHQIADRYVMGTLPAEEAERFENHYLSCPECLDRLDLTESVQRGFQRMATQDVTRLSTARQLAFVAWLAHLGRRQQIAAFLAALLVLTVLPTGLALRGIAGRERAQVQQPQANVPTLFFDSERGIGPSTDEPPRSVRRPEGSGGIVLFLQVDPALQPPFRAILRDAQGHELQRVEDLRPNERDDLSLGLPAGLVPPGIYSLTVESLAPGRKPAAAGRFAFQVLPPA